VARSDHRGEDSIVSQWCGIENAYTDHDTAHHDARGGVVVSDKVKITAGEHAGKSGIVQQVRGPEVVVRIPGRRGNTETVTVAQRVVERIG